MPRNFKIFIFEPKFSFLRENHKNYNQGQFRDFKEFSLCIIFVILKIIQFFKIKESTPGIIFMIFRPKWQFRLANENFWIFSEFGLQYLPYCIRDISEKFQNFQIQAEIVIFEWNSKKIQQKNSRNSFYRDLNIDQPKLRNLDAGQSKVFQLMNHFKVIYGAVWCRADIWTLVKLPFISMFYQKHCYHHFHDWRFKKYTHLIHWSLLLWHFSTVPCFYVSIKSKP